MITDAISSDLSGFLPPVVLNMSIAGSAVMLFVLLARLVLRRAPKIARNGGVRINSKLTAYKLIEPGITKLE